MFYISSLDLGTTCCRTYIFDLAGTIIASDYQEWDSIYPSPSYVEQDAEIWWNSIKKTIESAIKKSGIDKSDIIFEKVNKDYIKINTKSKYKPLYQEKNAWRIENDKTAAFFANRNKNKNKT